MIREAIQKVMAGNALTEAEMIDTMNEIMTGETTDAQIACFLTALRLKGETIEEITGQRASCGTKPRLFPRSTHWLLTPVAQVHRTESV